MLDWIKGKLARRWLSKSHVAQAFIKIRDEAYSNNELQAFFDDKKLQSIVENILQKITFCLRAEDPLLALREEIAGTAITFSESAIFIANEDGAITSVFEGYDVLESQFISGALAKYATQVGALEDYDSDWYKLASEMAWNQNEEFESLPEQEVAYVISGRFILCRYLLWALDVIRTEVLKDYNRNRDWFAPYIKSCLIVEEDTVREKLGLPSLLGDDMFIRLISGTFLNFVMSGAENPYYEWDKDLAHHEKWRILSRDLAV